MRTEPNISNAPLHLVPRMTQQGYAEPYVTRRRQWLERKTGCRLTHIGAYSIPGDEMRGNIENPVGAAQMPLGVAGPLLINGTNAQGIFYVPLATTEGGFRGRGADPERPDRVVVDTWRVAVGGQVAVPR